MAVTIKDIAREAGISVSAVSKALNGKSDIGDELKQRIRSIAEELGYKKNMLASRLVTMKSNTIGVFIFSRSKIKNTESTAFAYLNTMLDTVKARGYDIVLFSIETNYSISKSYIDLCIERQVEGAIFIGFEDQDPHLEELLGSDFPVILIEKRAVGAQVSCVTIDNEKGIQAGMNYLQGLGHERIAFIKGHFAAEVSRIRYETYVKCLEKTHTLPEGLVYEGDFSLESGYKIGRDIAKGSDRPTAVFAANDLMAIGLMYAFHESRVLVPQEISVMGFDNFSISKYVHPRLTTVSQDFVEVAIKAVELLFEMIHNGVEPREIVLDPELVVRDSCMMCMMCGK